MKKRRKEDGDMKAVNITRAVYKDIKRYDHKQMNEFLTRYYINGFNDGLNSAKIDYDVLKEVLLSVKGIGLVKADEVISKLKELEQE